MAIISELAMVNMVNMVNMVKTYHGNHLLMYNQENIHGDNKITI